MRIAVASIAKNESKHVKRWFDTGAEADYQLLVDTGSTDDTVVQARDLGATVHELTFDQFRFDDARNAAMRLLPKDIDVVLYLDMDEVITRRWRDQIEKAGFAHTYRFLYKSDLRPDLSDAPRAPAGQLIYGNRCRSRRGWRWTHPIHESLMWLGKESPVMVDAPFTVFHKPDHSRPRNYRELLEYAVRAEPWCSRCCYYLVRQLHFENDYEAALKEARRYDRLPYFRMKYEQEDLRRLVQEMLNAKAPVR